MTTPLLIFDGRIGEIGPSTELESRHGGETRLEARCREAAPAFWERYGAGVPDRPVLG